MNNNLETPTEEYYEQLEKAVEGNLFVEDTNGFTYTVDEYSEDFVKYHTVNGSQQKQSHLKFHNLFKFLPPELASKRIKQEAKKST